ncbi:MAG: sulfite exporter TauE/SafE family protein [Sphingobacteriales bacterium]|nr:sulfite exporter TauE/SafE family protein [Sphingobacteriales bacterium]
MSHLQLAFWIGLFGSFHCVGMCGPLAFALPKAAQNWQIIFQKLSYNLGRSLSYALLGLLMGLIGKQLWIAGWQQNLSILSGLLIVIVSLPKILPFFRIAWHYQNPFQKNFNQLFAKALQRKSGHFLIGMLNGFLPCGFVYLALATALSSDNVWQSGLFMFFFGLGTLPLMFAAMLGINFAKPTFRYRINQLLPVLTLCLGLWFIVRGLNLDIPYLSPNSSTNAVICH